MSLVNPGGIGVLLVLVMLALAIVASGFATVYSRHESRKRFAELQELRVEQDALQTEWGQLLLEEGAWATPSRIEQIARESLDMMLPDPAAITMIGINK